MFESFFLPLLPFLVGLLAVPLLGPTGAGIVLAAAAVGLLFYYRWRKWHVCAVMILRTLDQTVDGLAVVHPGVSLLVPEFLVPMRKQWHLVTRLQDHGWISLEKLPPRHIPPDITGMVMRLTSAGRRQLARYHGETDPFIRAWPRGA